MNIKSIFAVRQNPLGIDLSLLLVRLVVGLAFVIHGYGKIQNPFGWMPPGSPVPGALQALAAVSEFGGGLGLMVGLLTRLGSLGLVFTMIGAVATHVLVAGDPFVPNGGHGYELASIYLTLAVMFVAGGPGGLSLDRFIFGRR